VSAKRNLPATLKLPRAGSFRQLISSCHPARYLIYSLVAQNRAVRMR
jgi:hypothetical protein